MEKLLQGKTAVITGSNRGIGKKIVEVFAAEGAAIYACARKPDRDFEDFLAGISAGNGVAVTPVYFDCSREEEIKKGLHTIFEMKPAIDILVNNAGVSSLGTLAMTSLNELRSVFDVNYFAPVQIMQLVSRKMMRQRSGSIINIASVGGIESEPGYLAYGSSKAALIWATKCICKELGRYNIRVNAVAPGITDTEMAHTKTDKELENTIQRTALGRMAAAEEIAAAVLFLASDRSSYVTGEVMRVDGGRMAGRGKSIR